MNFIDKKDHGLLALDELARQIPIGLFVFEGIVIGRVIDVTEKEVISRMKSELLNLNAFSENQVYHKLQTLVQSLIGVKDIVVVDTPDALLVTTSEHAQRVKAVVDALRLGGSNDVL